MDQKERDVIMREFRSGSSRVLITTDLLVNLLYSFHKLLSHIVFLKTGFLCSLGQHSPRFENVQRSNNLTLIQTHTYRRDVHLPHWGWDDANVIQDNDYSYSESLLCETWERGLTAMEMRWWINLNIKLQVKHQWSHFRFHTFLRHLKDYQVH